jgi:hypothetical protein
MGTQIEELYASSFRGPFPYDDCRWLADNAQRDSSDLIPALDWYFATVAGYGSSASRLSKRSREELRTAERLLSGDFFHHFPDLTVYRSFIDREHTPRLYERMTTVEEMRMGLLQLLGDIFKVE